MNILDKIKNTVDDLEAQRRLGRNCNWTEIVSLADTLRKQADELNEFAWDRLDEEDEAAA